MPQNQPNGVGLRACSACSGDYEDPERDAWPAPPEEGDEDENEIAGGVRKTIAREEFPVQEG